MYNDIKTIINRDDGGTILRIILVARMDRIGSNRSMAKAACMDLSRN